MADYIVKDTELTSVANAIRTAGGTNSLLSFPNGFVSAVGNISGGGGGGGDTATITLDVTNQSGKTITLMGGADLFLVWTENVTFGCDMIATDEHGQTTVPLMNGQCFIGRFIALTTDQSMLSLFDVTTEGGIEYSMDENAYIVTGDGTVHGKWVSGV